MQRTILSAKHFTLFAAISALTLPFSAPTVLASTVDNGHHPAAGTGAARAWYDSSDQPGSQPVEGSLQRLNRYDLVLNVNEAEQTLSLEEVDTLWVSQEVGRAKAL